MSWPKPQLTGEISARYRPAGDVPHVTYPNGTRVRFVAPGSVAEGHYGLFEWNMAGPPGGADPHFHTGFSESFYITEGTVRLFDGARWIDATRGEFLYVPARPASGTSPNSPRSARPVRRSPTRNGSSCGPATTSTPSLTDDFPAHSELDRQDDTNEEEP